MIGTKLLNILLNKEENIKPINQEKKIKKNKIDYNFKIHQKSKKIKIKTKIMNQIKNQPTKDMTKYSALDVPQQQNEEEIYVPNEDDLKIYEENLQKQKLEFKEVEQNYENINKIKDDLKKVKSDISMSSKEFKLGYKSGNDWAYKDFQEQIEQLNNDKKMLDDEISNLRKQINPDENNAQINWLLSDLDDTKQKLIDNIDYLNQKQKENIKLKTSLTKTINVSSEHKAEIELLYKNVAEYEQLLKQMLKTDKTGLQSKIKEVQEEFKNEIEKFKDMTAKTRTKNILQMNKKLKFITQTHKLINHYVYIEGLHKPENKDEEKKITINKNDYDNLLKFKTVGDKNEKIVNVENIKARDKFIKWLYEFVEPKPDSKEKEKFIKQLNKLSKYNNYLNETKEIKKLQK